MNKKIKQLIEGIKYNIEKGQNEEAIRNYRELADMKIMLSSNVYTQSQFHTNIMDFIFKQKVLTGFREYSYILSAMFLGIIVLSDDTSTKFMSFLLIAASVFIYGAFKVINENRTPNKVYNNLLNRMNHEKASHASILYELDAIEQFQTEIQDKIEPLLEQENNKKINDIKEQVRKDLKEKYPDLNLDD